MIDFKIAKISSCVQCAHIFCVKQEFSPRPHHQEQFVKTSKRLLESVKVFIFIKSIAFIIKESTDTYDAVSPSKILRILPTSAIENKECFHFA